MIDRKTLKSLLSNSEWSSPCLTLESLESPLRASEKHRSFVKDKMYRYDVF